MIFYIQVQEHVFILIKCFQLFLKAICDSQYLYFPITIRLIIKRPTELTIGEAKKLPLFPKMWVKRNIFTRAAANLFFLIHFPEYPLFFFSFFCFFLHSCFLCLFVCFLKLRRCILTHIRLCGLVSDKKFFTRLNSGNKTTFFWPEHNCNDYQRL